MTKPSDVLKNIRVEYECSATINVGNFSNVKPSYALSADVVDGFSPTEARNILKGIVDAWLEQDVNEVNSEKNG